MDPVANLERQRELVEQILANPRNYPDDAAALAELAGALDGWRLSGGFDPWEAEATRAARESRSG